MHSKLSSAGLFIALVKFQSAVLGGDYVLSGSVKLTADTSVWVLIILEELSFTRAVSIHSRVFRDILHKFVS